MNLILMFKNTFLYNETKVFVVNCLKLHLKLQCLFCGALYNQSKCNKCAVPLLTCLQTPDIVTQMTKQACPREASV